MFLKQTSAVSNYSSCHALDFLGLSRMFHHILCVLLMISGNIIRTDQNGIVFQNLKSSSGLN